MEDTEIANHISYLGVFHLHNNLCGIYRERALEQYYFLHKRNG